MADFNKYFSVLALFILFRETIEASIICSVLLQFLHRSKPGLKKAVWWGVAGGVGVSIIFGVIFIVIYYKAQQSLFQGKNRDWFKGIISWIAALLITILGFAMLRFLGWEAKWKRKLMTALKEKVAEAEAEKQKTAEEVTEPASNSSELPSPLGTVPSSLPGGRKGSSDSNSAVSPSSGEQASGLSSEEKKASSPSGSADKNAVAAAGAVESDDKKSVTKDSDDDAKQRDATLAALMPAEEDLVDLTPPTRKESLKIWLLVFTTVVREGIESVVFLGGLGNVPLSAVPLPAIVGIVCGVLVGVFLYYSGKQVKHIMWLVIIMAIIIFFIAAGQVNIGTDALMKAGAFGTYSVWYDERPWFMLPMYDWSACCADTDPTGNEPTDQQNRQRFFALTRAIFGYQDKATPLEVILYCSYWSLTLALAAWKSWRGTLFDADYKYKRQQRKAAKEARQRRAEAAAKAAADADLKTSAVMMVVSEAEGEGAGAGAVTVTGAAAADKSAAQV